MAFERVTSLNELWEGEMQVHTVGGVELLLVNAEGGVVRAFDAYCPHQDHPLIEGELEGRVLTCSAHLWQFDVTSGEGVNPRDCRLKQYPVKLEGDDILVDVAASVPV